MAMIGYVARVLTGVRFKKMNHMIDVVHQKCGQNNVRTFFDMLWCAVRYGAGYYDYTMFGFYDMTGAQRDTYLTRVRNKKVSNIMNDTTTILTTSCSSTSASPSISAAPPSTVRPLRWSRWPGSWRDRRPSSPRSTTAPAATAWRSCM